MNHTLKQFLTHRPAISQAGFARELGITRQQLSRWLAECDSVPEKHHERIMILMNKYGWYQSTTKQNLKDLSTARSCSGSES